MATATKTAPDGLSSKTKAQLQSVAEGKRIPFNSKTTKEELVKAITKHDKNAEKQSSSKPKQMFPGEN